MEGIKGDIEDLFVHADIINDTDADGSAPPVDDVFLAAQQEKVDKTWFATAKQAFIILKTLFTIFVCVQAVRKWKKIDLPMSKPAQRVLLFNCLIVTGVAVYKFTTKQIAPLFLLQAASHYSCFCVLHVLLGYVDIKKTERRDAIVNIFKPMHGMFFLIAYLGFKASSCDQ